MPARDGKYDLEERTFVFARDARKYLKSVPRNLCNIEDAAQLVRSSGSVGANYIEANEAVGRKDFLFRIKICRKEAKESHYWLRLIDPGANEAVQEEKTRLLRESHELTCIFGAILQRSNDSGVEKC